MLLDLRSLWEGEQAPIFPTPPLLPEVFPGGVPLSRIHGVKSYFQKTRFDLETREYEVEAEISLDWTSDYSWAFNSNPELIAVCSTELATTLSVLCSPILQIDELRAWGKESIRASFYSDLEMKIDSISSIYGSGLIATVEELIESAKERRCREEDDLLDEDD